VTAAAVLLALTLPAAGCVDMPDGGPVRSDRVTQGADAQNQPYPQLVPRSPAPGASPAEIVRGFLTASASFADGQQTARDFLTGPASRSWHPTWPWSATVFTGTGPQVSQSGSPSPGGLSSGSRKTATVTVSGKVQAELSASGAYAVPSTATGRGTSVRFTLVRQGRQWRISSPLPPNLLLTSTEFSADYQLRNLYFLDPASKVLVPDPVYVPLQTSSENLLDGLVRDLISQPRDWLRDGTRTALPAGTRLLSDVMVNGAAEVNLGGAAAKTSDRVRELISSQLLSTLSGSGQGQPPIHSIVLDINGKPWSPPQADQNPVQHSAAVRVPDGASGGFYYTDSGGDLERQPGAGGSPVKVRQLGQGYSAIAVSPDLRYLAALRDGILYTGPLNGTLVKRAGSGYTTMSWDSAGRLWATAGGAVFMLRGDVTPRSAKTAAAPEEANVSPTGASAGTGPITAVRVAPDGVRMALIQGTGKALYFGAISDQPSSPSEARFSSRPGESPPDGPQITLSPFNVSGGLDGFSAVSWYGADNVVTLGAGSGTEGPPLTEYAVTGASSTQIPTSSGIDSISSSSGSELVAGTKAGDLLASPSPTAAWAPLGYGGLDPVYPGLCDTRHWLSRSVTSGAPVAQVHRRVVWSMLHFAVNVPPDNSAQES